LIDALNGNIGGRVERGIVSEKFLGKDFNFLLGGGVREVKLDALGGELTRGVMKRDNREFIFRGVGGDGERGEENLRIRSLGDEIFGEETFVGSRGGENFGEESLGDEHFDEFLGEEPLGDENLDDELIGDEYFRGDKSFGDEDFEGCFENILGENRGDCFGENLGDDVRFGYGRIGDDLKGDDRLGEERMGEELMGEELSGDE
jgi:hypothetical protein